MPCQCHSFVTKGAANMKRRNAIHAFYVILIGVILLLGVFFSFRFVLATVGLGLIVWGLLTLSCCR